MTELSYSNGLHVLVSLLLILALIFLFSFLLRKLSFHKAFHSPQIKIVGTLSLGTRERIVLLETAGVRLLLGITPTQITTLHVFAHHEENPSVLPLPGKE